MFKSRLVCAKSLRIGVRFTSSSLPSFRRSRSWIAPFIRIPQPKEPKDTATEASRPKTMMYTIKLLGREGGGGLTGIFVVFGLLSFVAYMFQLITKMLMATLVCMIATTTIVSAICEVRKLAIRCGINRDDDNEDPFALGSSNLPPFLSRMLVANQHHRDPRRKVWRPRLSIETAKERGFGTVEIPWLRSLHDMLTWVIEYKYQAFLRVVQVDLKMGRYARYHTTAGAYEYIMNTSLACFIDKSTGNVIMYDTWLPYGIATKLYHKITFELDHEMRTCQSVSFEELSTKSCSMEPSHTNTLTDAGEIGALVLIVTALKAHVNVHYHANGVSELTEFWAVASTSSHLTQVMNRAAVFVSGFYTANHVIPPDQHATLLGSNMIVEGLPFHEHLGQWAKTNRTHLILAKARSLLLKVLSSGMSTFSVKQLHLFVETILAATIMHSADHYYVDKFLGYTSQCQFLQVDVTFLRAALTPPNSYSTRRFLCREYPNDAICRALYQAAHDVDPEFADTALFVGIAN